LVIAEVEDGDVISEVVFVEVADGLVGFVKAEVVLEDGAVASVVVAEGLLVLSVDVVVDKEVEVVKDGVVASVDVTVVIGCVGTSKFVTVIVDSVLASAVVVKDGLVGLVMGAVVL